MNCVEYREWVAADVDDRLGDERSTVRNHVEGCGDCQRLHSAQQGIRDLLRSKRLSHEAPLGLRTRIRAHLGEEAGTVSWSTRLFRWGAFAAVAVAAFIVLTPPRGGALDPMIDSYYEALRGEIALSVRTDEVPELERFYRQTKGVADHVVDLEGAGFRLVGGVLRDIDGKTVRLSVYSDGSNLIVCDYRRLAGYSGALPEGKDPLFFSRAGLTFCIRRMGDEICILATRMPMYMAVPRLLGWA